MSHFTVLVIGDDVEKQLQPYHEYECTGVKDEYVKWIDLHQEVINNCVILGKSWFVAIGHVATIDFAIKQVALEKGFKSIFCYQSDLIHCNPCLLKYIKRYVTVVNNKSEISSAIGLNINEKLEADLRIEDIIKREFWYGTYKNEVRWFAPHFAKINSEWNQASNQPLFEVTRTDHQYLREYLHTNFGMPKDSWFVVLHVREPGYHASWHKYHVGTRNAGINDFHLAVDYITNKGGWVVRIGDKQMKELPKAISKNDYVIDYALSRTTNPFINILLCGCCEYFIGTNSGISYVPGMFGKKSVLTNWTPLAITNPYQQDIFIPKLVYDKKTKRYLSATEIFQNFTGWSQFMRDFNRSTYKLLDNEPEDILLAVTELHNLITNNRNYTAKEMEMIDNFNDIAVNNGGYVGSTISVDFLSKYKFYIN